MDIYSGQPEASNVSNADLAFMAGFFAGEGSVCIVEGKHKSDGKSYYNMHTGFATTESCWALWFHKAFGGHIHCYPPNKKTPQHKHVFFWRVGGRTAERFLRLIKPYLKGEKVPQVELALEFLETKCLYYRKGRCHNIVDQQELWASFKQRLKGLRVAAAETNRRDAHAWRSDSPTPQVTAD